MSSNSQAEDPPEHSIDYFSALLGAVIALLTLTLPLYIIVSFSSGSTAVNTTQQFRP